MSRSCLAVIPARYASTRLPGKPLLDIAGKTLLQRVWEQARKASQVSRVIVATDDKRIMELATSFGAEVQLTNAAHLTGTDRIAEVQEICAKKDERYEFIVNVQGDMPFIKPEAIDQTVMILAQAKASIGIGTAATAILKREEFERTSVVKVVFRADGEALYFSRAPIPYPREKDDVAATAEQPFGYKHIGIYAYRPEVLARLSTLPPTLLESREKLEQLRALAAGIGIRVAVIPATLQEPSIEVDTEEDLTRARAYAQQVP